MSNSAHHNSDSSSTVIHIKSY
uniref:Uncharacterized protein n=1 Tax=Anguilla anguilla TaxID=7936 RepID=A0A0E9QBS6_ANGAN